MPAPVLFFDSAGPDGPALRSFYSAVFGWEVDGTGQFTVDVASPLQAAIREDPAEKRIYIGVDDLTATLDPVKANGGTVDTPRFEVPGVAVLGLFSDPAGNEMGLVDGRARPAGPVIEAVGFYEDEEIESMGQPPDSTTPS